MAAYVAEMKKVAQKVTGRGRVGGVLDGACRKLRPSPDH